MNVEEEKLNEDEFKETRDEQYKVHLLRNLAFNADLSSD